jgi:polar amino acid transport system substrate-binding protein
MKAGWVLAAALALLGTAPASAQQVTDSRVADLVQAGKVRVGVGLAAAHWAIKDSATGEVRGVAVDLARALANRLGVAIVLVEYPNPPRVMDGLKDGAWDVAFLGVDPVRAALVDFSSPYLRIDANYVVPPGSPIRAAAEVDQPGVRVAVTQKSVEDVTLSGALKRAQLVRVQSTPAGLEAIRAGEADVWAAPRPSLLQSMSRLPGSRLIDERFHATFAAIAVPKGHSGRVAFINEFIAQAKASGTVQQAIDRAGLRGVVHVTEEK